MVAVYGKKGEEVDPPKAMGSIVLIVLGLLVLLFVLFMFGKKIFTLLGLI